LFEIHGWASFLLRWLVKWGFGPDSKDQSDPLGPSGGNKGRRLMRNNDTLAVVGAFGVHNAAGRGGKGSTLNLSRVRRGDSDRSNDNGQDLDSKTDGKRKSWSALRTIRCSFTYKHSPASEAKSMKRRWGKDNDEPDCPVRRQLKSVYIQSVQDFTGFGKAPLVTGLLGRLLPDRLC